MPSRKNRDAYFESNRPPALAFFGFSKTNCCVAGLWVLKTLGSVVDFWTVSTNSFAASFTGSGNFPADSFTGSFTDTTVGLTEGSPEEGAPGANRRGLLSLVQMDLERTSSELVQDQEQWVQVQVLELELELELEPYSLPHFPSACKLVRQSTPRKACVTVS